MIIAAALVILLVVAAVALLVADTGSNATEMHVTRALRSDEIVLDESAQAWADFDEARANWASAIAGKAA